MTSTETPAMAKATMLKIIRNSLTREDSTVSKSRNVGVARRAHGVHEPLGDLVYS